MKNHHAQEENKGGSANWRKAFAVAALPLAAVGAITFAASGPAYASGTTGKTAGCYAQWWNTAFAGYCVNTTQDVNVRLQADCSWESDFTGGWHFIGKGSTVSPFDSNSCTFSVSSANLGFK